MCEKCDKCENNTVDSENMMSFSIDFSHIGPDFHHGMNFDHKEETEEIDMEEFADFIAEEERNYQAGMCNDKIHEFEEDEDCRIDCDDESDCDRELAVSAGREFLENSYRKFNEIYIFARHKSDTDTMLICAEQISKIAKVINYV